MWYFSFRRTESTKIHVCWSAAGQHSLHFRAYQHQYCTSKLISKIPWQNTNVSDNSIKSLFCSCFKDTGFEFIPMCTNGSHFFSPCLEPTLKVLKMSLTEFSLPKFYQLFGISKVKSAAVSAFRTSYRPGDRSFTMSPLEHDKMSLCSLEVITDALLEIMEVSGCP